MDKLHDIFPFLKPITQSAWFTFAAFLVQNFEDDRCREKAASLTYTTMLAIVPIITVIVVSLSSIPALADVKSQIQSLIYKNLLPQTGFQVSQYINEFAEKSSNLTAIGVLILFATTWMMIVKIEDAFNRVWHVEEVRGALQSLPRYWVLMTLGPMVLGIVFAASSTITSVSFLNQQVAGYAIDWEVWLQIVTFLATIAGFAAMYWFIPNVDVPVKNTLIAGVVIALLFDLVKKFFGMVMANFTSYELIYGAFAALPILLLWIFFSWCIILAGVELSYALDVFATKNSKKRHPVYILLEMLKLLYDKQKAGLSVSERQMKALLGRDELANWQTYKDILIEQHLIARTEKGNYVLKRSLNQLNLWDFYQSVPFALPHQNDFKAQEMAEATEAAGLNSKPLTQEDWKIYVQNILKASDSYLSQRLELNLAHLFDGNLAEPTPKEPQDKIQPYSQM